MTSRRSFLIGIGAALAAPAVVRADSLMRLWVPKPKPKPVLPRYIHIGMAYDHHLRPEAMVFFSAEQHWGAAAPIHRMTLPEFNRFYGAKFEASFA